MRATRKWIKYTISGGILCFTGTLYLLCMMAPPGVPTPRKPPGGQGGRLRDIQKRHATDQAQTYGRYAKNSLRNVGGVVYSTFSDGALVADVWPNSNETLRSKPKQGNHTKEPGCESDCQRLEQLFQHEWPKSKPKALIYYLTRASRLKELRRSLESVETYFNRVYQYPVVIFHESDLTSFIPVIRSWTNSSLYFQLVTFSLPEFLTEPVREDIPCPSTIGYRHMCRFNVKLVYEYPIVWGADYVWRLDDESLLTDTVSYDVFDFMRSNRLQYGYIWEHRDAHQCVTDLWNSTERYIQQHRIPPNTFPQWKSPKLYYNNFEISSMALWRSEEYRSFIDYIDRLGGIYYHRWGDAPIKGIAVNLFVPKHKLHHFKDIGYQHNTFTNP